MRVLLLGGTGAVGLGCLDALTRADHTSVLLAGRDEARLHQAAATVSADVETLQVDLADPPAVVDAAGGCDVVINCAGPSHLHSASTAAAAIAARVPYVDPGGDRALLDLLATEPPTVPLILQTGVQPGLSGLLLRALAEHRVDEIGTVSVWCGGLQPLTTAAVLEYVNSLQDPHGHPGAALRDGVIRRLTPDEREPAPHEHFPASATAHPHLDDETLTAAADLGITDVTWMNVFDGVHTTRAMQSLAVDGGPAGRQGDLGSVLSAVKLDLFGRCPYFGIYARAHGNGPSTTLKFRCADSYRVTGALAAFTALRIADVPAGVRPFWRVGEPRAALQYLTDVVEVAEFSVTDDTAPQIVEEGSL